MSEAPRLDRRRRIFRNLFLALVAFVGGVALWWKVMEVRAWKRLEERVPQLDAEIRALGASRQVLRGTPIPGEAWEDYREAATLAGPRLGQGLKIWDFQARKAGVDAGPIRAAVTKHVAVLDLVRKGTKRASAGRTRLEVGKAMEIEGEPTLSSLSSLGCLGACQAHFLTEEHRLRESAELLLDLHQFGGDLLRQGGLESYSLGLVVLHTSMKELHVLIQSEELSPVDLGEIDRELEILDSTFPPILLTSVGDLERLGQVLLEGRVFDFFSSTGKPPLNVWSCYGLFHLLDSRLVQASGFRQMDEGILRLNGTDSETYVREQARWMEVHGVHGSSWNLLVRLFAPSGYWDGRVRRWSLAPLRLLRVAVHYRRTGEVLDLIDPFGDRILHREEGGELTAWCVGRDGIDHGSDGAFLDPPGVNIVIRARR